MRNDCFMATPNQLVKKKYLFRRSHSYFIQNKSELNPLQQKFISNTFSGAAMLENEEEAFSVRCSFYEHRGSAADLCR